MFLSYFQYLLYNCTYRYFSGRALKLNLYLLPINISSNGGRRGREASWKFQGAFHGVSLPLGTHHYAQEPATPYENTSMKSELARRTSRPCLLSALAMTCILQAKLS